MNAKMHSVFDGAAQQQTSTSSENQSFGSSIELPLMNIAPPDTLPKGINSQTGTDEGIINAGINTLDTTSSDSLKKKAADSLAALLLAAKDTIKIDSMKLDSTARLKYFKVRRHDTPVLSLYDRKPSKLFAQPSQKRRTFAIDSTGEFVIVNDMVGDRKLKQELRIPIDIFLGKQLSSREQALWDELAYKYELKSLKKDLGNLIKDITDFEIPLPSIGVLSIFGAPKISLRVSGSVDIHGAWRNESTEGVTVSRLGNTRNEPDFRQQVQINVNGTIGDKLQINADWNTERTFEYDNQLKIKYTGYEDEIIQAIEAGNVSLQTSSLVGGSEALFGVKADLRMGPLTLTAIASQKKGETKEKSVTGGSSAQTFALKAYQYSKNHFFLDKIYADTTDPDLNLFYRYYGNETPNVVDQYMVKQIEVWKSINQTLRDPSERNAIAYINLPFRVKTQSYSNDMRSDTVLEVPGKVVKGRFIRLQQGQDYILHEYTGYISFKTNIQESEIIAVSYSFENSPGVDDDSYYGEFLDNTQADTSKRLILKLIKPQNLGPRDQEAWLLQLKNIYPLGTRDVKEEGFEFDIKYGDNAENASRITPNTMSYLTAFGLDISTKSGGTIPDGTFDFKKGRTIVTETGEIIFPTLQPFGRNLPTSLADAMRFNEVYDTTTTFAQQNTLKDKFYLVGKSTGSSSANYQLGFNTVENSVRVSLNGRDLVSGIDYVVDYSMGTVTIRNESALVPGANLKISYEENDLFAIASKSLFGLRGMFDISRSTKLGFSMLTLSQQTLSDKVRLGEEPLSNSIYGIDFATQADLPFVTKLLDNVISTKEPSNVTLRGEAALMSPDPNTKKSTISSDNGNSIAYIDDFEGSKRIIPVGISYTSWKDLSVPTDLDTSINALPALQKMNYKAKSIWYNILPSDVVVTKIWPEKKVARGDEAVTVLDYVYLPDTAGSFNYNPDLHSNTKRNWGGVQKILSTTANNLVEENVEFIEFWAKVEEAPSDAHLYIDLGKISEDVIPNGTLNTEDKNFNELIDEGEDVGLDGLNDAGERTEFNKTTADPSNDNFYYRTGGSYNYTDYFNINGTEGNAALTDVGRFPDTEDLNKNGNLDLVNSYFRYVVPLDTNRSTNPYIVGGGGNNERWYLYRVPIKDFQMKVNDPSFTVIESIRMFVTNASSRVHFRLTEFNLVGNQWQKADRNDSIMKISVVNVEDNPEYSSPGGVQRERDRSRPDQEVFRNEQSLSLILTDLPEGQSRQAFKILPRPLDVFSYSEMKLFLHPDKSKGVTSLSYFKDLTEYASDAYFRFGSDSSNYYEYRLPLQDHAESDNWTEIAIVFSELTAIKQARDSANMEYRIPVSGKAGHYYYVRGNPALTQIKFFSIGVINKKDDNSTLQVPVSGVLWVNELRVIGADNTNGWAYSAAASLKFADLATVSLNLSRSDPFFHRLSERFGSRVEAVNWGVSVDMDLLKLLPLNSTESNLKLNYSRTESVGNPLYLPNTDIKVTEASRLTKEKLIQNGVDAANADKAAQQLESDAQSISVSDTWTLANIKFKVPSTFWLVKETINNLSFGFNYNKTFSRNPTTLASTNWVWNASMAYALDIGSSLSFAPVNFPFIGELFSYLGEYKQYRLYFFPQNFTYNVTAKRNRAVNVTRALVNSPSQSTISRDFGTTRGLSFNWKMTENGLFNLSSTYSFDAVSSLSHLETDEFNQQRAESRIWKDIFTSAFFGKDFQFGQNFELRANPKLPALWSLDRNITLSTGYGVRYSWTNDFRQQELGRGAGYSNKSNLGVTLRWSAIFEPLFKSSGTDNQNLQITQARGRDFDDNPTRTNEIVNPPTTVSDSSLASDTTTIHRTPIYTTVFNLLKDAVFYSIIDYENIRMNFSNENQFSSSGIKGTGTGFNNFWGIVFKSNEGPSRRFMLGLGNDAGPRAAGNLSDNSSMRNSLDMSTSKPLWEGARVELNWKVGWSLNKSVNLTSDGNKVQIQNITATGTINRSFLSIPPFFLFSALKSGIKRVNELYNPAVPSSLSDAFVQGFESVPWLSRLGIFKNVVNLIPRPNWRISWDGLEKYSIFTSWAKRVSLEHAYSSDYTEGWRITPEGLQETQTQKIGIGFQPLLGMNITFVDLWSGNFSGNIKYSTRSSYDLGAATKNITEDFSREIGVSLNYSKSGFELPLFGISLKNDIEISFSYSSQQNSTVLYDMTRFDEKGTPQNGTIRTTLEPRIKYVISSRVNLAIFYKRSTTKPEGAARIPPTTQNEAGLDIRISIQ